MNWNHQKETLLQIAPWCVDDIAIDASTIFISGWAIPFMGVWSNLEFFVNNKIVETFIRSKRTDLKRVFPFWSGVEKSGFIIESENNGVPDSEDLVISRNKNTSQSSLDNYYFPVSEDWKLNLPTPLLRNQVHGSESKTAFILEGFSSYRKLDFLVQKYIGEGINDACPILDWGCGCARVCRYIKNKQDNLIGVDINNEAISWCKEHISGRFEVSTFLPPLPFSNNHFKVVYGVSILTHLSPEDQRLWINELLRITQIGGVVILSYHGIRSLLRFNLKNDDFSELNEKNFVNLGRNSAFESTDNLGERYYDTVQTSDFFESLLEVPCDMAFHQGVFGNHQDVLVLKKLE